MNYSLSNCKRLDCILKVLKTASTNDAVFINELLNDVNIELKNINEQELESIAHLLLMISTMINRDGLVNHNNGGFSITFLGKSFNYERQYKSKRNSKITSYIVLALAILTFLILISDSNVIQNNRIIKWLRTKPKAESSILDSMNKIHTKPINISSIKSSPNKTVFLNDTLKYRNYPNS